jgi:hypothetical protein
MLSDKQEAHSVPETRSDQIALRLDHIFRSAGRWIAFAVVFFSICFTFTILGYLIPMNTIDHGDVGSVVWASILMPAGAIVGPIAAFFAIRSIRRGGI